MQCINDLIILVTQNEHVLEHDLEYYLEHKKQFSTPKIYDANGDLNKRWYIYFSYRNPATGKMQRMKNIYGNVNSFKTKADRYTLLNLYKRRLLKLLEEGYNPFKDNTELYNKKSNPRVKPTKKLPEKTEIKTPATPQKTPKKSHSLTIKTAFSKAIELKTNLINDKSLEDYKSRLKNFEKWLKNNHKGVKYIDQIDKKIITSFLNVVQLRSTPRNRNNYRTVFSSIFETLKDNDIIKTNFVKEIKPLRTKPKRHKSYSDKEQQKIFSYLKSTDPLLLLFIKFVSYNMLRPIEVCRLKIKDINLEEQTLNFKAKNKALKTKIIPDILFEELPDLSKMNPEHFLFTPNKLGGEWNASEVNRRDHFSKRYTKVKNALGFDKDYSLYSFRHTFITKLYRELVKNSSPFAAKSKLMSITGHQTMTALEKYLRDIDAELPEDYSELLRK